MFYLYLYKKVFHFTLSNELLLSPFSRLRCSSLRRSALRHLARLFWNQTCKKRRKWRRRRGVSKVRKSPEYCYLCSLDLAASQL